MDSALLPGGGGPDEREAREGGALGSGNDAGARGGGAPEVLRFEGGGLGIGKADPPLGFFGGGSGRLGGGKPTPPRMVPGAGGTACDAGPEEGCFFVSPSKTSRSLPLSSAIE